MGKFEIRVSQDGGISVEADFKTGRRRLPAVAVAADVKVKRPTSLEVVFGREIGKLIGLDDLRAQINYVDGIVESFAGDFEP